MDTHSIANTKRPNISFAIPTFNGGKTISEALTSIFDAASGFDPREAEIIVSSNGSTDNTRELIELARTKSQIAITYHHNEVNEGYDRNIQNLLRLCNGRFIWFLADDDQLLHHSIQKFYEVWAIASDLTVVIQNFWSVDVNGDIRSDVTFERDTYFDDPNAFLMSCRQRYGQLSSVIVSAEHLKKVDTSVAVGSNYLHVFIVYALAARGNSYIIAQPNLQVRLGGTNFGITGNAILKTAVKGSNLLCFLTDLGYSRATLRKLQNESMWYIAAVLGAGKLMPGFRSAVAAETIAKSTFPYWRKLLLLSLVLAPSPIVKLTKTAAIRINRCLR